DARRAVRRHRRPTHPEPPRRPSRRGAAQRGPRQPRAGGWVVMRFSAVHKLASYLMVASAYLALALSGELPLFAALLGGLGIVLWWFWEAPRVRPERWTVWWTSLAVAAFGWTLLAALSGGDWLIAGTDFVVFLLVAKLFNRRTSRDYLWV